MNDIRIDGSQSSPTITASATDGVLRMVGESYPENAYELFSPVFAWVEAYLSQATQPLRLELELMYLNTSSIKAVMDIFDMLEQAHQEGRKVSVYWYYDQANERVGELAEEFREDCSFAFHVVGK